VSLDTTRTRQLEVRARAVQLVLTALEQLLGLLSVLPVTIAKAKHLSRHSVLWGPLVLPQVLSSVLAVALALPVTSALKQVLSSLTASVILDPTA
jgi:hypothetical protein